MSACLTCPHEKRDSQAEQLQGEADQKSRTKGPFDYRSGLPKVTVVASALQEGRRVLENVVPHSFPTISIAAGALRPIETATLPWPRLPSPHYGFDLPDRRIICAVPQPWAVASMMARHVLLRCACDPR